MFKTLKREREKEKYFKIVNGLMQYTEPWVITQSAPCHMPKSHLTTSLKIQHRRAFFFLDVKGRREWKRQVKLRASAEKMLKTTCFYCQAKDTKQRRQARGRDEGRH